MILFEASRLFMISFHNLPIEWVYDITIPSFDNATVGRIKFYR